MDDPGLRLRVAAVPLLGTFRGGNRRDVTMKCVAGNRQLLPVRLPPLLEQAGGDAFLGAVRTEGVSRRLLRVGGDRRPAVAIRPWCVLQRELNHREEAIHRVLGYAKNYSHGLESFSDAAHHRLDCPVGPRVVRRCKMMRSSIDRAQPLSFLVLVVRALVRHPIRDDPEEGDILLHGSDHVVCATTVVEALEADGVLRDDCG